MTDEEFAMFRRKLKTRQERLTEEERLYNREFLKMINTYNKKYPEGIPFQMPYKFEELKEALEKDKPFHEWEKFKGYYRKLPDYCDL